MPKHLIVNEDNNKLYFMDSFEIENILKNNGIDVPKTHQNAFYEAQHNIQKLKANNSSLNIDNIKPQEIKTPNIKLK